MNLSFASLRPVSNFAAPQDLSSRPEPPGSFFHARLFYGINSRSAEGVWIAAIALTLVSIAWIWASPFTLKNARLVQRVGKKLVGHGWAEAWDASTQYTEADISPRLWTNGALPASEEFTSPLKRGFSDYKLRVGGLIEEPREFSYAQIKAMPKQEQIMCHFCVQGWSGVANGPACRCGTSWTS